MSRGCRSQAPPDSGCRGWLGLSSILLVVSCADPSADAGAILAKAASLPEVRVEIQEDPLDQSLRGASARVRNGADRHAPDTVRARDLGSLGHRVITSGSW